MNQSLFHQPISSRALVSLGIPQPEGLRVDLRDVSTAEPSDRATARKDEKQADRGQGGTQLRWLR